jgi:hypothetical protein
MKPAFTLALAPPSPAIAGRRASKAPGSSVSQ